ncbi:hypothetical protein ACSAGD_11670 [Paramicrobacterium sp. CJ85]|uniref:hypothetical protein n=1 Tax=Paramicrobacterium sp. CJ85 TaxID=3445355 RepID=UPI003F5FE6D2
MRGKAILSFAAAVGILGGLTGCTGTATFESPKELYESLQGAAECADPEFASGQDDEADVRYGMFYCSSGSLEGYVFKDDVEFESDVFTAIRNRDNKSTMDDDCVLVGDNWAVWIDGRKSDDPESRQLQEALGGELFDSVAE